MCIKGVGGRSRTRPHVRDRGHLSCCCVHGRRCPGFITADAWGKDWDVCGAQTSRHIRPRHLLLAYAPPPPPPPPRLTCLERLVEALIASPPVSASLFPKFLVFKPFPVSHMGFLEGGVPFSWADCSTNATVDASFSYIFQDTEISKCCVCVSVCVCRRGLKKSDLGSLSTSILSSLR